MTDMVTSPQRPDRWKTFWSECNGAKVYRVDGDHVRNDIEIDFVLGGHHYRYDCIPEDEVWIDEIPNKHDMLANLLHELVERELMKSRGWDYEKAHAVAAKKESEWRHAFEP